jgi:hypothetical protein
LAGVDYDDLGWSSRLAAQAFQQLVQVARSIFGCDDQGDSVHHDVPQTT